MSKNGNAKGKQVEPEPKPLLFPLRFFHKRPASAENC